MPFVTIYRPDGVFLGTGSGVITAEQWIEEAKKLYADPRFVEPTRVLWDLRDATFEWPGTSVYAEVEFVRPERTQGRGRGAPVVSTDLAFGVGLRDLLGCHGNLASQLEFEASVFREWAPAVEWIEEEF